MVAPQGGEGGSLEQRRKEIEVVVFDSCLQRPKKVILEGLSEKGLVIEVENNEEDEEEEEGM